MGNGSKKIGADGLPFGFFDCSFPFCDNSRLLFQSCGSGTGNDRNCQKPDEGDWITGQGEIQFEKGIGKKIINTDHGKECCKNTESITGSITCGQNGGKNI